MPPEKTSSMPPPLITVSKTSGATINSKAGGVNTPADGVIGISASQLAYMLDGIDWRNPVRTFRPERAG
jgi:hypothetical protein